MFFGRQLWHNNRNYKFKIKFNLNSKLELKPSAMYYIVFYKNSLGERQKIKKKLTPFT